MDVNSLEIALRDAGVDLARYAVYATPGNRGDWMLRPEDSVWLMPSRDGWAVYAGGVAPHYSYSDVIRRFDTEREACETFFREVTGGGEPFAGDKRRFSADCVRIWWENEIERALDEPEVAAQRRRWRGTWRKREAAGEPAMTVDEMLEAFLAAGGERDSVHVEGRDDIPVGPGVRVVGRDAAGRWWMGAWDGDRRPGLFQLEFRFLTEGEFARYFYDWTIGPWAMPPPLTLEQWREQRLVARENAAAVRAYRSTVTEEP